MAFRSFFVFSLGICSCCNLVYSSVYKKPSEEPLWVTEEAAASTSRLNKNVSVMAATLERRPSQCLKALHKKINKHSSHPNLTLTELSFSSDNLSEASGAARRPSSLASPEGYHEGLWSIFGSKKAQKLLKQVSFPKFLFSSSLKERFRKLQLSHPVDIWDFMTFLYYKKFEPNPCFTNTFQDWYVDNQKDIDKVINNVGNFYESVLDFRRKMSSVRSISRKDASTFLAFLSTQGLRFNSPEEYGIFWEGLSFLLGDSLPRDEFIPSVMRNIHLCLPLYQMLNTKNLKYSHEDVGLYAQQLAAVNTETFEISHKEAGWDPDLLSEIVKEQFESRQISPQESELVLDWLKTAQACFDPTAIFFAKGASLWYKGHKEAIDEHCEALFGLHDDIDELRKSMATTSQYVRRSTPENWQELIQAAGEFGCDLTTPEALAEWLEDVSFILGPTFEAAALVYTLTGTSAGPEQLGSLNGITTRLHAFRAGNYPLSEEESEVSSAQHNDDGNNVTLRKKH